uniref:Uncharacterized protein n=1 Tax=Nelumbo nucifera TaxID=4432 RepID=A0A822YHA0_NELNU|nr:TPA_asm: hypothetical protein HUJ06_009157 [Nelumbo nucifera]DAD30970.1 TPA_asm: hypothetical protein HUJ06_009821 [Nelumbo nucifera]
MQAGIIPNESVACRSQLQENLGGRGDNGSNRRGIPPPCTDSKSFFKKLLHSSIGSLTSKSERMQLFGEGFSSQRNLSPSLLLKQPNKMKKL